MVVAKYKLAVAAILLVVFAPRAAADVFVPFRFPIHITSNSSLRKDSFPETEIRLPPGYFFDEPVYGKLDGEMRRLQEAETRLKAENESLRDSSRHFFPAWALIGAAAAVGLAGGVWIGIKIKSGS